MKLNIYCFLFFLMFLEQCSGQANRKSDLDKDDLNGNIEIIKEYSIDISDNTEFLESITHYSRKGMQIKFIPYEKDYGYLPMKVTDSLTFAYDDKNRMIQSSEYVKFNDDDELLYRIRNDYFTYNECDKKSETKYVVVDSLVNTNITTTTMIDSFAYNRDCKLVSKKEEGDGQTTSVTTCEYNEKGKLTKRSLKFENDEKPYKVESYLYDEPNNKVTYLEYNEEKKVYRDKKVQYFDASNNLIKEELYNAPTLSGSIIFSDGEMQEPQEVIFTKKYEYNKDKKLTKETHLDKNQNEIYKTEFIYSNDQTEKIVYQNGDIVNKVISRYKQKKPVERIIFTNGKFKKADIVFKWNYSSDGKLKSKTENYIKDKDRYTRSYEHDQYGNIISEQSFKNGQLIDFRKTDYVYYK